MGDLLPPTDAWGVPVEKMPDCPRCGDDELGMLRPGFAKCNACGHRVEERAKYARGGR